LLSCRAVRNELNCLLLLLLLLLLLPSLPFPPGKGVMKSDGKPRFTACCT
jgi:hypothetical protein